MTYSFYLGLYDFLNNRDYYSLEINYVARKFNLSKLNFEVFQLLMNDSINIFTYNNITYIGLESRRIDYERDKKLGINWVEKAIREGKYG